MSDEDFRKALAYVTSGPKSQLTDAQRLVMYGAFKQITVGPCTEKRPSSVRFVACAKYDAWKKLGDMKKADAVALYIKTLESVAPRWRAWTPAKL